MDSCMVTTDYEGIDNLTRDPLAGDLEQGAVGFARQRLHILVAKSRALRTAFSTTLAMTVGLILASITFLALTPLLTDCTWLGVAVLLGGVCWFALCLWQYSALIRMALG
jgi:hypothetical protein